MIGIDRALPVAEADVPELSDTEPVEETPLISLLKEVILLLQDLNQREPLLSLEIELL